MLKRITQNMLSNGFNFAVYMYDKDKYGEVKAMEKQELIKSDSRFRNELGNLIEHNCNLKALQRDTYTLDRYIKKKISNIKLLQN